MIEQAEWEPLDSPPTLRAVCVVGSWYDQGVIEELVMDVPEEPSYLYRCRSWTSFGRPRKVWFKFIGRQQ